MQLTKELETEILQEYYAFWEANFGGHMNAFASYMLDDFSIFGSANGEVFFSKSDAIAFYTATVDQLAGKAKLLHRNIRIRPLDENSVVVLEQSDLYVLVGNNWIFYGNARITCILKHTTEGWKGLHQHASFPDHRTEEGEQLASEKIEKENLELRDAVKRRTIELENKNREIEDTMISLRSTQAQLIQSEKMASLGELTAGIAHEIQNPLNFVNNFSEVNREMLEEAEEEINKGNYDEAKSILNDVKDNSEKINHHGKRADAIVKGMLQHSRQSSGKKEPTDINALCDEYLGLSYHGLRAKDKSFNAEFKTEFDENIGKVNIIPQDIGRVLLNLINNAFYAVNEKKKTADENYKPFVSVQTKKINGKIEIKVIDNGNGIPQNIIDKIFQPFFTTKPTGQGTGLGLSLAYDIITKKHNGTIKVESKDNEGSIFIIQLPLKA